MGKTIKDKKDVLIAIEKNSTKREKERKSIAKLWGKITLKEDPIKYQHRIRD